ncbi:helix-turn-helix transcriptional regulator [Paracoccus nototheniae]|uniref:Helix-turn-helix transcriptional regulator n=1 Tax=Paracoccus nototheniae TaxID=2489002 RepID=A0ABW4DR15_9RHOB|nr:helix-turn-helix domain-containing protein [Paracoccus nototheniae]
MINSRLGGTALVVLPKEAVVPDSRFLTPDEVAERYRGGVSVGTLRNWRAMRLGPSFVKIGKAVLYPLDELDAWDEKNKVQCRASKGHREPRGDQA